MKWGSIVFWLFSLVVGSVIILIQLSAINPSEISEDFFYVLVALSGVSFAAYIILFLAASWQEQLSFARVVTVMLFLFSSLVWLLIFLIAGKVNFSYNNWLSYQTFLAIYFLAGGIALLLKKISRYQEPPEKSFDSFI